MSSRWIALVIGALLASQEANAACVIDGARPTGPLPTMEIGQEFSFVASRDCETLRFTIRGTTVSKIPRLVGPMGPGFERTGSRSRRASGTPSSPRAARRSRGSSPEGRARA